MKKSWILVSVALSVIFSQVPCFAAEVGNQEFFVDTETGL